MNKNLLIVGGLIIGVILLGFFVAQNKELGSVNVANEYSYTQLSGSVASSSAIITANTLGSIIITEDSAVVVDVYDATSTAAVGTPYAYKIADLQAALTEGVYTFDVRIKNGKIVLNTTDWTAFAGDFTVTYR